MYALHRSLLGSVRRHKIDVVNFIIQVSGYFLTLSENDLSINLDSV